MMRAILTRCGHARVLGLSFVEGEQAVCPECHVLVPVAMETGGLMATPQPVIPQVPCRRASRPRRDQTLFITPQGYVGLTPSATGAADNVKMTWDEAGVVPVVNNSWWQDIDSGAVFTVVEGIWVWVTREYAIPVILPLVPRLRMLYTPQERVG